MSTGWIKLHRQIKEWEWYDDINTARLFIHCLIRSNFKDSRWKGQDIKRGSFITSLETLKQETSLTISQLRTAFSKLELSGEIEMKSQARSRVVTVVKYDSYQDDSKLVEDEINMKSQGNRDEIATDKNLRTKEVNNKEIASLKNDGFDHWWKSYPKKVAKPAGLKAFKSKTKKMGGDSFMEFVDLISSDSANRYLQTEKQFIPNPATYLNEERYNDE